MDLGEVAINLSLFGFEVFGFGGEDGLVDGVGEVGVEEAVLHALEFGLAFGEGLGLFALLGADVGEGVRHCAADEGTHVVGFDAELGEFGGDGLFKFGFAPADFGVVRAGVVVGTAVVDVVDGAAIGASLCVFFAADGLAAVGAADETTGEFEVGFSDAAVAAFDDVLALLEEFGVDQGLVFAGVGFVAPDDVAEVDGVVEDVRDCFEWELWLAGAVDVAFCGKTVGDGFEGHVALCLLRQRWNCTSS